jgi:hypothetical protein
MHVASDSAEMQKRRGQVPSNDERRQKVTTTYPMTPKRMNMTALRIMSPVMRGKARKNWTMIVFSCRKSHGTCHAY